jgi:hypothetical protein
LGVDHELIREVILDVLGEHGKPMACCDLDVRVRRLLLLAIDDNSAIQVSIDWLVWRGFIRVVGKNHMQDPMLEVGVLERLAGL